MIRRERVSKRVSSDSKEVDLRLETDEGVLLQLTSCAFAKLCGGVTTLIYCSLRRCTLSLVDVFAEEFR